MTEHQPFWRRKSLAEMTVAEWESLCDGCGKCCLLKFEHEDDGAISFTDVSCTLFDGDSCRCRQYDSRQEVVPDCVQLTPGTIGDLHFMPPSCAYRRLREGRDLPEWHPLVTGDPNSVHAAEMSCRGRVESEDDVDESELLEHIVDWPEYVM